MTSGSLHQILKDWDGANFELRKNLLTQFCQLTAGKSAFDMTEELGHRTALLFARFLASLRLRFNKPGVGLLLDAIRQFVGAAGGLEHIDDLVASGAVLTVIEMIGLDTPTESDKAGFEIIGSHGLNWPITILECVMCYFTLLCDWSIRTVRANDSEPSDKVAALRVVHCVAQAGLEYKEVLCKTGAIRIICECLAKSKEDECRDECHVILQCLAAGNPKFVGAIYRALIALLPCDSPSAVHVALQLLRQVQPQVPPIKELAAPLLATMGSYHGEVRYEARLLFVSLVHSEITNYLFQGSQCSDFSVRRRSECCIF